MYSTNSFLLFWKKYYEGYFFIDNIIFQCYFEDAASTKIATRYVFFFAFTLISMEIIECNLLFLSDFFCFWKILLFYYYSPYFFLDAEYTRSQDHHHLHHILESIARYNRCNPKSRRLMLIHVDEKEDFNMCGAFGTPSMISHALTSGLFAELTDGSHKFTSDKVCAFVTDSMRLSSQRLAII